MKTIHLDRSKLLGFHTMSPARPVDQSANAATAAKSKAKIGVKIGVKGS